jgi:hypothetical protein
MSTDHKLKIIVPPVAQEVLHHQLLDAIVRWGQAKANTEVERYAEDDIRSMIRNLMRKHARAAIILDRDRQAKLAAPRVSLEFMTQRIEFVDGAWHTTLIHVGSEHGAVPLHPTLYKGA